MSTPTTPAANTTADTLKLAADLGLAVAQIALPGSGSAIQLGRIAAQGVIELYDRLMASRPEDVTLEEWRALLTAPIHSPGFVDDLVNQARARQTQT